MFQKKKVNKLKLAGGNGSSELPKSSKDNMNKRKLEVYLTKTEHKKETENIKEESSSKDKDTTEKKIYMDYEPLLCKEFKLKGYCGYGDTCKFIHSRDEYINDRKLVRKHWKKTIEAENNAKYESETPKKAEVNISDKCLLCDKEFSAVPTQKFVQLQCQHVFCKDCMVAMLKKGEPNCKSCGVDSKGVMKTFKF